MEIKQGVPPSVCKEVTAIKTAAVFKRVEKKYMLTPESQEQFVALISAHLTPDAFGKSTVCSLYLDTPEHLLIRNSIDAKDFDGAYKEKIRLRSYGTPSAESKVFLELKKKFDSVVYKRRVSMTLAEAERYLQTGQKPKESQIMNEIDYAMRFYHTPAPAMMICYEREAWFDKENPALRITFDSAVRCRNGDLSLASGNSGIKLLPDTAVLMEIKTDGSMPLWLADALDACRIFPTSFSKYGTAYLRETNQELQGEYYYV